MTHPSTTVRVPTLMVAFDAKVDGGKLTASGPVGVKFPPRLPAEVTALVAMALENPAPTAAVSRVRIDIADPAGATVAGSARDHTVRWAPAHQPGAPVFNYIIDPVTSVFTVAGLYTVRVFVDDDTAPRAVTSFGVFLL